MDPVTLVLVLVGMTCMLLSFVAGVYAVLNKPTSPGTTLLSAEDLAALAADAKNADATISYSNVSGAQMVSTSISTLTDTAPATCQRQCDTTPMCQGFQLYGDSCDLLANVTSTYAFSNTAYNLVVSSSAVPYNILTPPVMGEIDTRWDMAATPSPSPPDTVAKCAKACKQQEGTCKSFSWSDTAGCKLKKAPDQRQADVAPVDQSNFSSYFLKGVTHDSWSAAPAPSSS